jgi:hypothetical protein
MEKATENTPPPPLPASAATARFARDRPSADACS